MRLNDSIAETLYRRLGLESRSRMVPLAHTRHVVRQLVKKGRTLHQICDMEQKVTGKQPDHSTVIHSLQQTGEYIEDAYAEVIMTLADILREKGY
jgi:chromosomal replication initiation ATPase DnaA